MSFQPGDRIGHYLLVRVIGRGRFGMVYEARDEAVGRKVAIKVMHDEPSSEALERFERETQIAATVQHPALVTLHESGTIEGQPYLVRELLEGEPLSARLGRARARPALRGEAAPPNGGAGSIDPTEALGVTADILGAVATMHQAGIVHLDLTPANVFMTGDGRIKVLNFGLAGLRNGGTLDYMAPEQIAGGDERSDVYSAGVILLEMLLGELRDPSAMKLAPMRVRPVLARALAKDPDQRYAGGTEMLKAIATLRTPERRRRGSSLFASLVAMVRR
ncbi:MAG TPA: serine/threonine-protein kinase [Kofleriaceae bacterium]